MRKSFLESHHNTWRDSVVTDLLNVAIGYSEMCVSALDCLLMNPIAEWTLPQQDKRRIVVAELVASMLEMLSYVIDPTSSFGIHFRYRALPRSGIPESTYDLEALAQHDSPGWGELAALKFDQLNGWRRLCQVRVAPCAGCVRHSGTARLHAGCWASACMRLGSAHSCLAAMLTHIAPLNMRVASSVALMDHHGRRRWKQWSLIFRSYATCWRSFTPEETA